MKIPTQDVVDQAEATANRVFAAHRKVNGPFVAMLVGNHVVAEVPMPRDAKNPLTLQWLNDGSFRPVRVEVPTAPWALSFCGPHLTCDTELAAYLASLPRTRLQLR